MCHQFVATHGKEGWIELQRHQLILQRERKKWCQGVQT